MGDFNLDASFHRDLRHILDDADLSLDQRLERLAGLLDRLEPALLKRAATWPDDRIEQAFVEFVKPAGRLPRTCRMVSEGTQPVDARLLRIRQKPMRCAGTPGVICRWREQVNQYRRTVEANAICSNKNPPSSAPVTPAERT